MRRARADVADFAIVNSINPDRIAGQTTAAFEVVDDLGDAPHFHFLPVGNAGNITAYWEGYRGYQETDDPSPAQDDWITGSRRSSNRPGQDYRTTGNGGLGDSDRKSGELDSGTGTRSRNRGGAIDTVTDEEILEAQTLAREQGRDFRRTRQCRFHRWAFQMLRRKRSPANPCRDISEGSVDRLHGDGSRFEGS